MIDLTKGAKRPCHRIRLSKEAKADMATWLTFLDKFNGKTFFLEDKWETSPSLELFTDAAGSKVSIGFAARGLLHGPPLILPF